MSTSKGATPSTTDKGEGKVIKKKRNVTPVDAKLFVSPTGVPKIYKQLSSVKFQQNNNKERLRTLISAYTAWGRELCPTLDFNEFILKTEKFSGAHLQMLDSLRREEEWDADSFVEVTRENGATSTRVPPQAESSQSTDNTSTSTTLTEEQKERIARNRAAALAKQQARQQQPTPDEEEIELEIDEDLRTPPKANGNTNGPTTTSSTYKLGIAAFDDEFPDDMFFDAA